MHLRGFFGLVLLAVVLSLALPRVSAAQGSESANAGQFDFSLPGARSLSMGGAFVALADDATATYSNPAGLILLGRPEISVEGRAWDFTATAIDRGHAFGVPTGNGLDTLDGVEAGRFHSRTGGASFVSFVYPGDRWALGVFRHEFPAFETRQEIQGAFFDCSGGFLDTVPPGGDIPFCSSFVTETDGVDRIFPRISEIKIEVSSVGATFAFKLTDDFSVGVSALYYSFSIDSTNKVFSIREDPFGPVNPNRYELLGLQQGEDNAFALNAGIRWQVAERWIVGATFRGGPGFEYQNPILPGPQHPFADGCVLQTEFGTACSNSTVPFSIPETYAFGVAFRPVPVWTVMFQYDLVEFSDLLSDQTSGLTGEAERVVNEGLMIDDAHRFRAGFEYMLLRPGGNAIGLRGGVWHDNAHRTFFEADPETGLPFPREALLFPKGHGLTHFTAGVGYAYQPHFQVDAGVDLSEDRKTFSVSGIWKF